VKSKESGRALPFHGLMQRGGLTYPRIAMSEYGGREEGLKRKLLSVLR